MAFAAAGAVWATPAPPKTAEIFDLKVKPAVERYCLQCHNSRKARGGVDLARFTNAASVFQDPSAWEKVVRQVQDNAMPPAEKAQPSLEERLSLVESTSAVLNNPEPAWLPRDPGAVVIRRLSRAEYNNTLRDLLGITNHLADSFPADGGGGGGFDNNGATLFVPPLLMEQLVAAAEDAIQLAPAERLFCAQRSRWRSDRAVAKRNVAWFVERAWRKPAADDDVERLLKLYDDARGRGAAYEDAVKRCLRAALVSPNFLFRIEHSEAGAKPWRLNDPEIASRLSYFLWASMPDDALRVAAASGKLSKAGGLEAQVRRMLADPKAAALSENFASQWLGTRKLAATTHPDRGRFPQFTDTLRDAMIAEPVVFFASLLREDASLLRLIDADYTYANAELARLYGLTNGAPAGGNFTRVPLPDRRRGGVLGMAAILAETSYPLRTSPVLRGKWILEEVLGTPPPPPPPLVATLPTNDNLRDGLTFRQQLEQHRKNPNCAGCHSRLDPLGFALENFDPIGAWRDRVADKPVDAQGVLVNGEKVDGPVALKEALLARKALFIRHLTEKMLAYALGRGLEVYDYPVVKKIEADLALHDYKASRLVLDIAESYPFQWRRAEASRAVASN